MHNIGLIILFVLIVAFLWNVAYRKQKENGGNHPFFLDENGSGAIICRVELFERYKKF